MLIIYFEYLQLLLSGKCHPGMYAITMSGELPEEVVNTCEELGIECKVNAKLK
jgi:hypothetical protein